MELASKNVATHILKVNTALSSILEKHNSDGNPIEYTGSEKCMNKFMQKFQDYIIEQEKANGGESDE